MSKLQINTEKEVAKLNDLMIRQFGEPPKTRGIIPELEWLIRVWLFYNDQNQKYNIENFDDELNINMLFYVGERMEHLVKIAYSVYNVEAKEFYDIVKGYLDKKEIPTLKKNSNLLADKRFDET